MGEISSNFSPYLSVLICTHNRADILQRTLESLADVRWDGVAAEVVVVANTCSDDTVARVASLAEHIPVPVRCVEEPEPGLNAARNRCLAEARGEILAFLDDDVRLDPSWATAFVDIYQQQPCDLVAGRVTLWWEAVERPEWLSSRFDRMLSAADHGLNRRELTDPSAAIGANMSFRRAVYEAIGQFRAGLDRKGHLLLGGGDEEYVRRAMQSGFRLFYEPAARVEHWVAPKRATEAYLKAIAFGNGYSGVMMKPLSRWGFVRSVFGHLYLLLKSIGWSAVATFRDRSQRVAARTLRRTAIGGLTARCHQLTGRTLQ